MFGDIAKLTSSEVFNYRKDEPEDLTKFYYDFSYLLGTPYYRDVRIELVSSPGWIFSGVYTNIYRLKEHISFKFCHLEPSRRAFIALQPQ